MPEVVEREAVLTELERILSSRRFQSAESLSRFLRFTVERTLEGRGAELKELLVGIEVFRRGAEFDPRTDSIVRVEASRLRSRLGKFYDEAGPGDAGIRIELPRGTYVPVFQAAPAPERMKPTRKRRAPRIVGIAAVALIAVAALWWTGRPTRASTPSPPRLSAVAVLPFVNVGGDAADEYFSDGMTEEILTSLSRQRGLRVTGRSSSFQFKGRNVDLKEAGAKLGVDAIVEGSVRRDVGNLRVTARLVNASTGYQMWTETFERPARDVFAVRGAIAAAVARTLSPDAGLAATRPPGRSRDPEAHNLLLKARYLRPSRDTAPAIIGYLEQAVAKDPEYSDAWIALADLWVRLALQGEEAPKMALAKAAEALNRADLLGEPLPRFFVARGTLHWARDRKWAAAERDYRRAVELDPNSAPSRVFLATLHARMGRTSEALALLDEIRMLDPLDPGLFTLHAEILYHAREYDRAIEVSRAILASRPELRGMHYWIGRAQLSRGEVNQAIESLRSAHGKGPQPAQGFGMLSVAYAAAGRREEARKILASVLDRARARYVSQASVAQVYLGLGEHDRALDAVERAYAEGDPSMISLKAEAAWDPLRGHPRFRNLLRRLDLE